MKNYFKGRTLVIFGGGSYIAQTVIRQLIDYGAAKIICIDNSEDKIFWIKQEFKNNPSVEALLGDVCFPNQFAHRLPTFDFGLYMAATKHVGLSEESPEHALSVNSIAVTKVQQICMQKNCKRFVYVSSDKR